MPQYQGVWSLQQQMQALTSGQWATDPLFDYTTLLLQADDRLNTEQNNTFLDSSTNQFLITRNGNTTQGTFSPFSATGWSVNFGTSDTTWTTTDIRPTADFTIEGWIYPTNTSETVIITFGNESSGRIGFFLQSSTLQLAYDIFAGPGVQALGTPAATLNTWNHFAIVRSGSTITGYINGVAGNAPKTQSGTLGNANLTKTGGNSQYISNMRYITGQALYTGTFTPATSPLTTTSVGSTGTGAASSITGTVRLLVCQDNRFKDNSSNNFSISSGATASVQAFSPFAPQFQYTASVTGGSGYFDGTTDYLTTPTGQTALTLGTGNFTIELWFYPTTQVNTFAVLYSSTSTASYTNGILVQLQSSTTLDVYMGGSAIKSAITFVPNSWNHLVVQRSATSTMSIWMNGASVSSVSTSSADLSTNSWQLSAWTSGSHHYTGYMSSFRITKGGALYSGSTITLPTAPLTTTVSAGTANLLLNFTNAGILDGTMKNNLETVADAKVSTSVVKYGSGSMYFDGTGDYLSSPSSQNYAFGTGDFTIEFWVYSNDVSTANKGMMQTSTATGGLSTTLTNGVFIAFGQGSTAGTGNNGGVYARINNNHLGGNSAAATGVWYHIALTRASGTARLFVNGTQIATISNSSDVTATNLAVGGYYDTNQLLNGYLDDFRITKGIARYTQNFIPPSVALPRQ